MSRSASGTRWRWTYLSVGLLLWPAFLAASGVDLKIPQGTSVPGASGAAAAPPAPVPQGNYVGSEKCGLCHKDEAAKYQAGPHAATLQAPVDAKFKGCEACHGPGSAHLAGNKEAMLHLEKMKPAEVNAICLKCHGGSPDSKAPQAWQNLSKAHWADGEHGRKEMACTTCHSEHHGQQHQLVKDTPALCTDCHQDKQVKDGAYQMDPVAKGLCLSCHDPHGTGKPSLSRETVDQFCTTCHHTDDADFTSKHGGYDLTGAHCTSCHDPHSKDRASNGLPANQHMPFKTGKCNLCHEPPSVSRTVKLIVPANQLCVRCHANVVNGSDRQAAHLHFPVQQGYCLGCHNPHASNVASPPLFKAPAETVCLSCHSNIKTAMAQPHAHPPVQQGLCLTCHDGHKSENEKLLVKPAIELCDKCHSLQHRFSHPVGFRQAGTQRVMVTDPRTGKMMTCATCHDIHGGPYEHITIKDAERDLCIQCHRDVH